MKEKTNLKKSKANFESFGDVEIYNLKKQKMLFNSLTQRGITLIALVVSIIVLLILVGISIQMLTGDNGILKRASEAKTKSIAANEEEAVKLAAQEALTQGLGTIDTDNLKEALESNLGEDGTLKGESPAWLYTSENEIIYSITETGKVKIIDKDTIISKPKEDEENYTGYVGYYADVDGDGTVDGVIYADLAMETTSGYWYNNEDYYKSYGAYTITQVAADDLGEYYISETGHTGENFDETSGGRDVVSLASGGTKERFYVMSLTDFTADGEIMFDWYNAAYGNMSDWSEYTSTDFGKGKENTTKMIARWKLGDVSNGGYGKQDNCASHKDIWGQIQAQVNEGWYIPSRGELSAFAKAFEITTSNYSSQYKLSNYYWSSSQFGGYRGWISNFIGELMYYDTVRTYHFVRLTATF